MERTDRQKEQSRLNGAKSASLLDPAGQVFVGAEYTFNKLSLMEARFSRQYNKAYKLWAEEAGIQAEIPPPPPARIHPQTSLRILWAV